MACLKQLLDSYSLNALFFFCDQCLDFNQTLLLVCGSHKVELCACLCVCACMCAYVVHLFHKTVIYILEWHKFFNLFCHSCGATWRRWRCRRFCWSRYSSTLYFCQPVCSRMWSFTDYANMLYFCWPKYSSMYIFANLFAVVYLCWLSYSSLLYLCWPRHSSVTYFHWPRYSGVPFFCWPRHSSVTHSSVTCCHWPTFSSISTIVCHTFSDRGTAVCHTFADILQQCAIHLPT